MRSPSSRLTLALALAALVLPLRSANAQYDRYEDRYQDRYDRYPSARVIADGTTIQVRLDQEISTDQAKSGDTWTGRVERPVLSGRVVAIPAGSPVSGVVTVAERGDRQTAAQLGLAIETVTINGRTTDLNADTEPIVAGSARSKRIGAIAAGSILGAVLGGATTESKTGALIGGLIGGAAGYGVTRDRFRTLELDAGTVVDFTTLGSGRISMWPAGARRGDGYYSGAYDRDRDGDGYRDRDYDRYSNTSVLPEGTVIDVRLDTPLSTATSREGDRWRGTLARGIVVNGRVVVPAGTRVSGVVTIAEQGTRREQAQIGLLVWRANVFGTPTMLHAESGPIIESTRYVRWRANRTLELPAGTVVSFRTTENLAVRS
jgi:hypothetical protein